MTLHAGIVAVQGNVREHARALERAASAHGKEITTDRIRTAGSIPDCDLLVIPGGESTTISRLIHREGLDEEITAHVEAGKPILATCAGLIVLSTDPNDDRVDELRLLDVTINRNAFGRQKDSFEAPLDVVGFDRPFPAVFIRAPVIESTGTDVDVLATVDGRPVAVQDGPILGTSFHPELTEDFRIHDQAFFTNDS